MGLPLEQQLVAAAPPCAEHLLQRPIAVSAACAQVARSAPRAIRPTSARGSARSRHICIVAGSLVARSGRRTAGPTVTSSVQDVWPASRLPAARSLRVARRARRRLHDPLLPRSPGWPSSPPPPDRRCRDPGPCRVAGQPLSQPGLVRRAASRRGPSSTRSIGIVGSQIDVGVRPSTTKNFAKPACPTCEVPERTV